MRDAMKEFRSDISQKTCHGYMDRLKNKLDTELKNKTARLDKQKDDDLFELRHKNYPLKLDTLNVNEMASLSLPAWLLYLCWWLLVAVVVLSKLFSLRVPGGILVAVIGYPVFRIVMYFVCKNDRQSKIQNVEKSYTRECARLKKEAEEILAEETRNYDRAVNEYIGRFSSKIEALEPMVDWVCGHMDGIIRAQKRDMNNAQITAKLWVVVTGTQIHVYIPGGYSGHYEVAYAKFDDGVNGTRYARIKEAAEMDAVSYVVTKMAVAQLSGEYEEDPIAPMPGVKPQITLEKDDYGVAIVYKVENPNYRAVVRL